MEIIKSQLGIKIREREREKTVSFNYTIILICYVNENDVLLFCNSVNFGSYIMYPVS